MKIPLLLLTLALISSAIANSYVPARTNDGVADQKVLSEIAKEPDAHARARRLESFLASSHSRALRQNALELLVQTYGGLGYKALAENAAKRLAESKSGAHNAEPDSVSSPAAEDASANAGPSAQQIIVWANTASKLYFCPGEQGYAQRLIIASPAQQTCPTPTREYTTEGEHKRAALALLSCQSSNLIIAEQQGREERAWGLMLEDRAQGLGFQPVNGRACTVSNSAANTANAAYLSAAKLVEAFGKLQNSEYFKHLSPAAQDQLRNRLLQILLEQQSSPAPASEAGSGNKQREDSWISPPVEKTGKQASKCESGHWIESVSDDGEIIKLEDGSIWRIDDTDTIDSALWLPTEDVLVCPGQLINTDSDNEHVGAKKLK